MSTRTLRRPLAASYLPLLALELLCGLCLRAQASGDLVVDLVGEAGETVRLDAPAVCLDYGEPCPDHLAPLSVRPQGVGPRVAAILKLGDLCRGDLAVRYRLLASSPVYADVLDHQRRLAWLRESPDVQARLATLPELRDEAVLYDRVADILTSDAFLEAALQRAVWAVSCGTKPSEWVRREEDDGDGPHAYLASRLDRILLEPCARLLLAYTGPDMLWAPEEAAPDLPIGDEVDAALLGAWLSHVPAGVALNAARGCEAREFYIGAAFYCREALRHHSPDEDTLQACRDLLSCCERVPSARRSAALEELESTARDALSEIAAGTTTLADVTHAVDLRGAMVAALSAGDDAGARDAAEEILAAAADRLGPAGRCLLGVEAAAGEAELVLLRLAAESAYAAASTEALEALAAGAPADAASAAQRAVEALPGRAEARFILAEACRRTGDAARAEREVSLARAL